MHNIQNIYCLFTFTAIFCRREINNQLTEVLKKEKDKVINCIFTRALFAVSLWEDTPSSEASIKVTLISRKILMQLFVFQQCQWLINNKVTQAYLGQSGYIILSMTLIPVNQLLTSDFLENLPASSRQCSSLKQ